MYTCVILIGYTYKYENINNKYIPINIFHQKKGREMLLAWSVRRPRSGGPRAAPRAPAAPSAPGPKRRKGRRRPCRSWGLVAYGLNIATIGMIDR